MCRYKFLGLWFVFIFISGCSMFSPNKSLNLNIELSQNTNSNKILAIIIVPMDRSDFIKTSYKEALNYVGRKETKFISLTPLDFKEGAYDLDVYFEQKSGVGIFVFFTNITIETKWKQYISDVKGRAYTLNITKNSIIFDNKD